VADAKERYVFVKHLAEGGMADVFLARDVGSTPPRLVVVKRLLADLRTQKDHVAMFLDESDLAMRLAHPNIVRAYDRGSTKDGPFLVMEYLAGYDLDLVIERLKQTGGQLPWELAVRIITAVAHGMAHAHELTGSDGKPLNLVHRDLTPSNVFLTFDGLVKVLDFGIARAEERRTRTSTGMLKGKARYLAPEQIQGLPVDGRVDEFALGAALYEVLTLKPLFQGDNELAVIHAILERKRPQLSQVRSGVPALLDVVFETMTAQLREDRYPSMRAVAQALEAVVPPTDDWRATLSGFVRQHFGPDFEAHASLMARLASASTSELKAFFEKGTALDVALADPGRQQKTAVVTNPQIPAEARRTPMAGVDVPLELPTEPLEAMPAVSPTPAPTAPLRLPGEDSTVPELLPVPPARRASSTLPPVPAEPSSRRSLLLVAGVVGALGVGGVVLKARKPPAPTKGSLFIRSVPPGATLEIDGRPLPSRTPTAVTDLGAGPHQLIVKHPDALPAAVVAEVAAGEQRTVDVVLPSREGTVSFTVTPPGAVVLVDGREVSLDGGVGRTEPLTAGRHEVTVRALGYQQKVLELAVDDGKHDSVQVELTPESQAPVGLPVEPR
jgi:serine/threonine protein kinase